MRSERKGFREKRKEHQSGGEGFTLKEKRKEDSSASSYKKGDWNIVER